MKTVHLGLDGVDFPQPPLADILHQFDHRRIIAVHVAGLEGQPLFLHQIDQPVKVRVGGAAGLVHMHGKAPLRRPKSVFRQPPVLGFDADRIQLRVVQDLFHGFLAQAVVDLLRARKDLFVPGRDGKARQLVKIALLLQGLDRRRGVVMARADLGNFQFLHFSFLQSN